MDIVRHLISHVVTQADLITPLEAGVKSDWLISIDPEARQVWDYVVEFHARYDKVASAEVLAAEYPNYKLVEPEPIGYVLDKLRDQRAMSMLDLALHTATQAFAEGDVDAVKAELQDVLTRLTAELPASRDTDITQTAEQRMTRYREVGMRDGQLQGITSGFEALDAACGGFRPGQFIVIAGGPKVGKSTMLLWSAMAAHMAVQSPLFLGFEMGNQEQEERVDALRAQVSATALRDGNLPAAELLKVERSARRMELMRPFWLSADTQASATMTGVSAKIDSLRPSIVYIDGLYLMQDDLGEKPGSPQALTNVSRSGKRTAQNKNLPVVATHQGLLSRMPNGEMSLGSLAYSSALGQDADLIIGVEATREHDIFKVKLLAGRNCAPFGFFVRRDWKGGVISELDHDPFGDSDDGDDIDDRF